MTIPTHELKMYKNFDELVVDVLHLAKEILPDKLIYLNHLTDDKQITLKISDSNPNIKLKEGMVINLEEGICNRVDFQKNRPLIYEDISKVSCLDDLQKTLAEVNIKAYLGIPIPLISGERFGTLCAAHHEPNKFDEKSVKMLERIAKLFSCYLELERLAYRDSLKGLYNRQYLYNSFKELSRDGGSLYFLDLDGFKNVNDIYGHDRGDLVLKEVALKLRRFIADKRGADAFRLGGDEFIVNLPLINSEEETRAQAEALLNYLNTWETELEGVKLSASIGVVRYPENNERGLSGILTDADKALYKSKAAGKNRYSIVR